MADKREALLNSALELFSTRGYESTPTSLISKNAGVATGTLFHHFSSKEELINQLYLDCKLRLMRCIEEGIVEKQNPEDKLKAIWEAMIGWALKNEERFLFIMQNKQNSYIKHETHQQVEAQSDSLVSFASELFDKETLREMPAALMGELATSMLEGMISYFSKHPDQFDNPEVRENTFQVFMNAFMK